MHDNNRGVSNNMMLFPQPELDSIKYYKQALQVSVHHFYIVEEIGNVGPFLDMINVLKTAEQHDTIFIYLNTPGGNLHTAIQIISAIRQSNATVVTCIEGEVASAGTMIFLAGHKHVVNPNCTFMIHNYSTWLGGKGNEVSLRVKYFEKYFRKLANDMYDKFLTPEELEDVVNGKDFWMESEEVLQRLGVENSAQSVQQLMEAIHGEGKPVDEEDQEEELLQNIIELAEAARAEKEDEAETVPKKKSRAKKKKPLK